MNQQNAVGILAAVLASQTPFQRIARTGRFGQQQRPIADRQQILLQLAAIDSCEVEPPEQQNYSVEDKRHHECDV